MAAVLLGINIKPDRVVNQPRYPLGLRNVTHVGSDTDSDAEDGQGECLPFVVDTSNASGTAANSNVKVLGVSTKNSINEKKRKAIIVARTKIETNTATNTMRTSTADFPDPYIDANPHLKSDSPHPIQQLVKQFTDVDDLLSKSVVQPGFEKLHSIPPYEESTRKSKLLRKKEREKTKGKMWFNLPATEMTEEVKRDLEIIQMRSALDPKRFYKKNDLKVLPKYFQVGHVVDNPIDYYHSRLTKKERKRTIVEELLADAEFQKRNKKKYKEILEHKNKLRSRGAFRHSKKLKKKK